MVYFPATTVVAAAIAKDIHAGVIRAGAALPTRRELQQQHDVAMQTIHTAMIKLKAVGLVHSKTTVGTYAKDPSATTVGTLLTAAQICAKAAEGEWEVIPDGLSCLSTTVLAWMAEAFDHAILLLLDDCSVDETTQAAAQAVCDLVPTKETV